MLGFVRFFNPCEGLLLLTLALFKWRHLPVQPYPLYCQNLRFFLRLSAHSYTQDGQRLTYTTFFLHHRCSVLRGICRILAVALIPCSTINSKAKRFCVSVQCPPLPSDSKHSLFSSQISLCINLIKSLFIIVLHPCCYGFLLML